MSNRDPYSDYLLRFERVDNWERTASRSETGLLIPSGYVTGRPRGGIERFISYRVSPSLPRPRQANDNLHRGSLADDQSPGPCPRGRGHEDHHHRTTGVWRHRLATVVGLAEVTAGRDAVDQARCHAGRAECHGLRGAGSPNALVPESQLERRGRKHRARGTRNKTSTAATTNLRRHQDRYTQTQSHPAQKPWTGATVLRWQRVRAAWLESPQHLRNESQRRQSLLLSGDAVGWPDGVGENRSWLWTMSPEP
jgi:hypothetical protein